MKLIKVSDEMYSRFEEVRADETACRRDIFDNPLYRPFNDEEVMRELIDIYWLWLNND